MEQGLISHPPCLGAGQRRGPVSANPRPGAAGARSPWIPRRSRLSRRTPPARPTSAAQRARPGSSQGYVFVRAERRAAAALRRQPGLSQDMCGPPVCRRSACTTCDTPTPPWPWPPASTRASSRAGWATPPWPSPWMSTPTSCPSRTARPPRPSPGCSARRKTLLLGLGWGVSGGGTISFASGSEARPERRSESSRNDGGCESW